MTCPSRREAVRTVGQRREAACVANRRREAVCRAGWRRRRCGGGRRCKGVARRRR